MTSETKISIDMSMTAPACGTADVLRADAERVVRTVPATPISKSR